MIIYPSIFVIGLGFLLVAAITDIKSREVPDWLSFGFLFTALFANLAYSVFTSNFSFIIDSITGLALAFLLGLLLYYTGQWGGGDSKILMALFALIGISASNIYNLILGNISVIQYILDAKWILFIISFTIIGGLYGILYSLYLMISQPKNFKKSLKKLINHEQTRKIRIFITLLTIFLVLFALTILVLLKSNDVMILIFIALLPLIIFYTWIFAKSIDLGCMNKKISAKKITIGDWVVEDVFVKRKTNSLLFDWHREYVLQTENKIKMFAFEKRIALMYTKQVKGFFSCMTLRLSKRKMDDAIHLIRALLMTSSKTKLIQRANHHGLSKEQTKQFLDFLDIQKIYFNNMYVCGFQTTGLGEDQVSLIKQLYESKKLRQIKVKIGIPFIPSFLIGFVIFYILGFWWTFLF